MDAELGVLRTGCGQLDQAIERNRRSSGMIGDQAFLVSQKILSIWAM
ncbi:hypothetical protein M2271_007305 [Streptomyces sp. LBL]|nr:hypothetical protein [Streptomyces sp. LBL]